MGSTRPPTTSGLIEEESLLNPPSNPTNPPQTPKVSSFNGIKSCSFYEMFSYQWQKFPTLVSLKLSARYSDFTSISDDYR
jgi:hypothetical protein